MGMTTTPIIGTVVGALAGIFATVFGVREQDFGGFARIGGFGLFCVIGVLAGIIVRAHNLLGVGVKQQVAEWVDAGYSPSAAQRIVMYRELGLVEDSAGALRETKRSDKAPAPSMLGSTMSAKGASDDCPDMDPSRFANDPKKILSSYRAQGTLWGALAQSLDSLPPERQTAIVNAAWRVACTQR